MPRSNSRIGNRRQALLRSIEPSNDGGITTQGAQLMAKGLGGVRAECTITGYCRTSLFRYPGVYLKEAVEHHILYSDASSKAAIVSDLADYFERCSGVSLHYSIDVSLRDGVRQTYQRAVEQAKQRANPDAPLFIVIEEYANVPSTMLNSGECFTIEECRNGTAIIEGGREGKKSLLAFKTGDGAWPKFHSDSYTINMVLAAVMSEQNFTRHIEELYSCFCFVSSKGEAVYSMSPTMSATLQTASLLESEDVRERADGIASMLHGMMSDPDPTARELFDSMVLGDTKDDGYLRLWYLRLWQALEDAGRHLGYPQLFNLTKGIGRKGTPKELKEYRNEIAHWYTGRINFSLLSDLQCTAMVLVRRKYRCTVGEEGDRSK